MSIGQRLKEERGALKMNQTEFAALAGTTKQTLFSWETGKTAPDAIELAAFAAHGVDVLYVLTGARNGLAENYPETGDVYAVAEERVAEYLARRKFDPKTEALLNNYQNLSEQDKDALGRLADSLAQSVTSAADESA